MQVAIVGGTGDLGRGLAIQFGRHTDHEIIIGSRESEKARAHADRYRERTENTGTDSTFVGKSNLDAARAGDVVILSVPSYHARETIETIEDGLASGESILVTPVVGLSQTETGTAYNQPEIGSVTELMDRLTPNETSVVGAFHNVPAGRLTDSIDSLTMDILLVGDESADKDTVFDLIEEVEGFRSVDAGPLAHASKVESLTSLLINISEYNDDMQNIGIKFV